MHHVWKPQPSTQVDNAKSFAMRLLMHYVGDVHQPLHAATRVNHEYPEGDRGSNKVSLPFKDEASDLHSIWDAIVYSFDQTPYLPFCFST